MHTSRSVKTEWFVRAAERQAAAERRGGNPALDESINPGNIGGGYEGRLRTTLFQAISRQASQGIQR